MQRRAFAALLALTCSLAACSHGYLATGRMDGVDRPLQGDADLDMAGGGQFVLDFPNDGLVCEGIADPPDTPSSALDCKGETGTGVLRCTDGRRMRISWQAITCRAFEGVGVAPDGKMLRFSVQKQSF